MTIFSFFEFDDTIGNLHFIRCWFRKKTKKKTRRQTLTKKEGVGGDFTHIHSVRQLGGCWHSNWERQFEWHTGYTHLKICCLSVFHFFFFLTRSENVWYTQWCPIWQLWHNDINRAPNFRFRKKGKMLTWAALGTCQIARVSNVGPSTISIRSPTQLQHIFVLATKPPRISHFQQSSFKQTKNLCCFKVLRFNAFLFLKKTKKRDKKWTS